MSTSPADRAALRNAIETYSPGNENQVSETAYKERLTRCESCAELCWRECGVTRRPVIAKARRKDVTCPIGRWNGERADFEVAVVIPCHNYGRYLGECLDSVLAQSRLPAEILVVDDASIDETREIAEHYRSRGVRYERINEQNVFAARQRGFELTYAEILCFLDADDRLSVDYLESGVPLFGDPRVGIVYPDVLRFGTDERTVSSPDSVDVAQMARRNDLSAGSLVRRRAWAGVSFAESLPEESDEDWLTWRRVMEQGWLARKQPSLFHHRRHEKNRTNELQGNSYFQRAGLQFESVTIAITLWGRGWAWPILESWLNDQSWPSGQTRLMLLDKSGNPAFAKRVRRWMATAEFSDLRYIALSPADPQAGPDPNRGTIDAYNRVARECTTQYVLVMDDDVVPPSDVCRRLLNSMDAKTDAIAAACPTRSGSGYDVWRWGGLGGQMRQVRMPSEECESVGGSKWGCTLLRQSAISDFVFSAEDRSDETLQAFFWRLHLARKQVIVDWGCRCERLRRT